MPEEYWVDGFNMFHHWEATRDGFRAAADPGGAIGRSLRLLERALGRLASRTTVFLDGGIVRESGTRGLLRYRFPGPRRSADDLMEEASAALGTGPAGQAARRRVAAVTNDRNLAFRLRGAGVLVMGVDEFLGTLARKPNRRGARGSRVHRVFVEQKYRTLTPLEVQAWLEYFGGDANGSSSSRSGGKGSRRPSKEK